MSNATKTLLDRYQWVLSAKLEGKEYTAALDAADTSRKVERTVVAALGRARALAGLNRFEEAFAAYDSTLTLIKTSGAKGDTDGRFVEAEVESTRQAASITLRAEGAGRLGKNDFEGALRDCRAAEGHVASGDAALCIARSLVGWSRFEDAIQKYNKALGDTAHPLTEDQPSVTSKELADTKKN